MEKLDHTISIGSEVGKTVSCSNCGREGTTEEFITLRDHKGKDVYLCPECKEETNQKFLAETTGQNIILAGVGGIIGAVIGSLIWYFITTNTGQEIGYISLGLGYLVGFGVYLGSGKKRGLNLQILSAFIAILAIFITEKFIFDYFVNSYITQHLTDYPMLSTHRYVFVSFLDPDFLQQFISPIGLLIYAIGIYIAFKFCKPRKI
jgi:hypothetical protein